MGDHRIVVIPCSGIGKPLGSVSRQATYRVVEDLRPESTATTCLALIVAGDEKAVKLVKENPCIALDGCPRECARKNIELAGGRVATELKVMDIYKEDKSMKPESVLQIGEGGERLADTIAERIARESDRILREVTGNE